MSRPNDWDRGRGQRRGRARSGIGFRLVHELVFLGASGYFKKVASASIRAIVPSLMNFRLGFLAALSCLGTVTAQEEPIFGYGDVVKKAEALAQQPFAPQLQQLSRDLQNLDYDLYRRIRFLPEHTVWPSLPYRLGVFHPGYYYKQRVLFHAIEPDRIRDIPFSPSYFHYDKEIVFSGQETFAGLKVYVPSTRPGIQDEFLSFLGVSYFRAIAKGLHWGLSTRGLGVDTGLSPEEFPSFCEFWIRQPTNRHEFAVLCAIG